MTGRSVLLVEDNADVREAIREILEEEGYGVQFAANGRDALELLKAGPSPCLILLDLLMPVMDGWEFLTHRRNDPAFSAVPVVILSAVAHRVESKTVGAAGVLAKPVDGATLLRLVRAHC